jgi:hypothetical protein
MRTAGQAAHEDTDNKPLIHESAKGLSKLCRDEILKGVLQGRTTPTIVNDIRRGVLIALQHEHQLESEEATLAALRNKQIPVPPDYLITDKDVENVRRPVESHNWRFTNNPAQNVRYLTQLEPENIVFYQEQQGADRPFILCFMVPWQMDIMLEHGHGGPLLLDDTFQTNKEKVFPHRGPIVRHSSSVWHNLQCGDLHVWDV